MNEFETIGKISATTKCLQKQMHKQAIKVATVPNAASTIPIVENRFAIAQPVVKPIT